MPHPVFLALSLTAFAVAPGIAAARCPARDFAGFARSFAGDVAVQRAHTAIPLTDDRIDPDADPEPATVTRMLDARSLRFPVMPDQRAQARAGLSTSIRALPGGDREVKLARPDTGYQIRYRFRRAGDCWRLVRRSDDSL